MVFGWLKQCLTVVSLILLITLSIVPFAWAGKLLNELQVENTCGTTYADNLVSCTPFHCQQPSPLAMLFPSEEDVQKMSAEQLQKMKRAMAAAEKRIQGMTPQERIDLKAKMTSTLEIIGFDKQGYCLTETMAIPSQRMNCTLEKSELAPIADYSLLAAGAKEIEMESKSRIVDGKMVTTQIDIIDGQRMENPWKKALDDGRCKIVQLEQQFQKTTGFAPSVAATSTPATLPSKIGSKRSTLFILDASGSMWGQIKGKAKITIAKEVMAKLVPELPANNRIGLIAYGHRRKGDCNDVEVLVPLGEGHKSAVLHAVSGLNAKGKTPLTRSVNRAFKMLQREKGESTIILVSDGIESCDGDPCAKVKAAKKYGIKFVLNTIGFGLSKGESAQLQCMAEAGGGQFFQADNAEQLLKVTRKAVQLNGFLKVSATVNGKTNGVLLRIIDSVTKRVVHENVLASPSGMRTSLPEGTYDVYVRPGGVNGAQERLLAGIKIVSGTVVEKSVSFDKGRLKITVTINGQPAHALVHVEDAETHAWLYESSVFGTDTPVTVDLPAGRVNIVITAGEQQVLRADDIEIRAGETSIKVMPLIDNSAELKEKGMEPNTNRWGMDYRDLTLDNTDPALCQQICQKEAQCQSWTYVKQGKHCWLKSGLAPASPDSCCVSGVKSGQAL